MTAGFRIEKLRRDHPVDVFICGSEELDRFLMHTQAVSAQTYIGLNEAEKCVAKDRLAVSSK